MALPSSLPCVRVRLPFALLFLLASLLFPAAGRTQTTATTATPPRHPPVCAEGVQQYSSLASVPQPFDTLTLPKGQPPIRVSNPEEAAAAQRQMAERAGAIGATGMVTVDESEGSDGGIRMVRRHVMLVFVPSDSARAQAACRGPAKGSPRTPPDSSY